MTKLELILRMIEELESGTRRSAILKMLRISLKNYTDVVYVEEVLYIDENVIKS